MPFIIPSPPVAPEGLVLDGLDLAQGPAGLIMLHAFTPPMFRKRPEWVEGADSDGAILAREPLMTVGDATVTVAIPGVSRDDANTAVADIAAKLEEAERHPGGIPLEWTPSGGTVTGTCYVLTGEITEMPVDWESGYMANQPMVTFTLSCAPGWYTTPVVYTGSATAGPLVELELADVPGDVPSPATLTVTEASSQNRRTVEWGAEHRYYDSGSPWSLILDSDSLVTSGFAGTQTTLAGAYDPGASGNSIITTVVGTSPQAICGTGTQPHVGTFRVKARINTGPSGATNLSLRLVWRAGDGPYTPNNQTVISDPVQEFLEVDLGLITIPEASSGTQSWDGRVEGWRDEFWETIYLDYLMLIPVEAGYGKARASYAYTPGVITARDAFSGTTAGNNLNGRTADVGGTWATSGSATDYVFADPVSILTVESASRVTTSDASARFAILGTATPTDSQVDVGLYSVLASVPTSGDIYQGVIARWTDSSNYLRAAIRRLHSPARIIRTLQIVQVVAGVETQLASVDVSTLPVLQAVRLIVFASGRALAFAMDSTFTSVYATAEATSSTLATGGILANGKTGLFDMNSTSVATSRYYTNVAVSTPAAEPIAVYSGRSLEIRHDSTERESSAGGTWGRLQSYRGGRFKVQPAGDADRTTRVVVKASRNDLDSAEDANLTDQISLAVEVTPRYAVLPRP